MKRNIGLFLCLIVLSIVTFAGLSHTYFQQDEWYFFGKIVYAEESGFLSLIHAIGFHFIPLSTFTFAALFELFHLQYPFYILFSLLFHAVNALLVFFVAQKLIGKPVISVLASVLFLVAVTSAQAVTWVAASVSILPSATFGLISVLCFLEYMNHPQRLRFLIISILSLLIGLLWKEDIVFLFLFYPVYSFVVRLKYVLRTLIVFLCVGGVYVVVRYILQAGSPHAMALGQGYSVMGVLSVLARMLLLPVQSFSKLYVTPEFTLSLAHGLFDTWQSVLTPYIPMETFGYNFGLFVERIGVAVISSVLSIGIAIGAWAGTNRIKHKEEVRHMHLMALFIVLSVLPFGLLPGDLGMESRHYYFPMVGAALLGAFFMDFLITKIKHADGKMFVAMAAAGYIATNVYMNQLSVQKWIEIGRPRQRFVSQAEFLYRSLPSKVIVYSSGDDITVQSGVGQMLLVIFRDMFPSHKFLENYFLWDLYSEGYTEVGANGFGYFSDFQRLKVTIDTYHLSPENVVSFAWDAEGEILQNSTDVVRQKLIDNQVR